MKKKEEQSVSLFDHLFGWVYIAWVRKSLVGVSVFWPVYLFTSKVLLMKIPG